MFLDTNTLLIAIACACLFAAALLIGIYRLNPGEPSIGLWTLGNLLIGAGSILAFLQDQFINPVTVAVPNLLLVSGNAVLVSGLLRFLRCPVRPALLAALVGAQFLVHVYFIYAEPLFWMRQVSTSVVLIMLALWPLMTLLSRRAGEHTFSVAVPFLVLGYSLQVVAHAIWAVYTLQTRPVGPFLSSMAPSASITLLQILCTSFIVNISFVLLVMERIQRLLRVKVAVDDLTGVFNRRAFRRIADAELARAERSGARPALMVLDLDHFKRVNDRFGHHAGDEVLRRFGALLKSCTRGGDIVARMGGEEFAALLPATDLEQAIAVAERIRTTLEQEAFRTDLHEFHITTSIGLTVILPEDTLHAAFARADHALYAAKEAGRNRVMTRTEPLPVHESTLRTEPPESEHEHTTEHTIPPAAAAALASFPGPAPSPTVSPYF